MAEPRIDIVLYRDPDAQVDLWVFVDGERVMDYHLIEFDPGRGFKYADAEERQREVAADESIPPAVREVADEQFEIYLASPYGED